MKALKGQALNTGDRIFEASPKVAANPLLIRPYTAVHPNYRSNSGSNKVMPDFKIRKSEERKEVRSTSAGLTVEVKGNRIKLIKVIANSQTSAEKGPRIVVYSASSLPKKKKLTGAFAWSFGEKRHEEPRLSISLDKRYLKEKKPVETTSNEPEVSVRLPEYKDPFDFDKHNHIRISKKSRKKKRKKRNSFDGLGMQPQTSNRQPSISIDRGLKTDKGFFQKVIIRNERKRSERRVFPIKEKEPEVSPLKSRVN